MNKPVNYIGSLGESFARGFYGDNIENNERKTSYDLASSGKYKRNAEMTLIPGKTRYVNHKQSIQMYGDLIKGLGDDMHTVFGFDIETFGNAINPANSTERNTAMISEFAVLSTDVSKGSGKDMFGITEPTVKVNYTFGINNNQYDELNKIIGKVSAMNDSGYNGDVNITSTELASFQNLQRYGGENLSVTRGSNGFFKYDSKTKLYTIERHADIIPFDVTQARQGLENMKLIGANQFFGTDRGDFMVNGIKSLFNSITESNSTLATYNGTSFDLPFSKAIFDQYGVGDVFNGINHFDAYQTSKSINGFNVLDESISLAKKHGVSVPLNKISTLEAQSNIRGVSANGEVHRATTDISMMLKAMFSGETPIVKGLMDNFSNVDIQNFEAFDSSKVFYSNKALRISSNDGNYAKIQYGLLDQYYENGEVHHNRSYSTGKGQYYGVEDFGFIPRKDLHEDTVRHLNDNSEGLWYMNLKNKASGSTSGAVVFRESIEDINSVIQGNFKMFGYSAEENSAVSGSNIISQYEIDRRSEQYFKDNLRRNNDRKKNPKDYMGINAVRKDNLLYEHVINNRSTDIDVDAIVKEYKDYNIRENDVKSFISRFNRVSDEYEFNKEVLNHIDSNITYEKLGLSESNVRDRNILNSIKTDAYNKITDDIGGMYINSDVSTRLNMKIEKLEKEFNGEERIKVLESDLNTVDLLRDSKDNIIKSNNSLSFNKIDNNAKYTSVDGASPEILGEKIRTLASNSASSYTKNSKDELKYKKKYLTDLTRDLQNRGVLPDGSVKKIKKTDDLYEITNSIANDIYNVLEIADKQLTKTEKFNLNAITTNKKIGSYKKGSVERKYAALRRTTHNTINLDGRKINNVPFSDAVHGILNENGFNLDSFVEKTLDDYIGNAPKTFSIRDKKKFSEGGITEWLKGLGYTDRNIETFKSALFDGDGALGSTKSDVAFHFYEREINGINVPFMAMSDKDSNLLTSLMRGEKPTNAVEMILPYVTNPTYDGTRPDVINSNSRNRVIRIGDSQKSIANSYSVFVDKRTLNPTIKEEDVIDQILNVVRVKKNEIKDKMGAKDYRRLENSINNYTKRLQLDEIGTSQKVTVYNPDGTISNKYVPSISDLDLADKKISDDLVKFLPYLNEYAIDNPNNVKSPVVQLMDQIRSDFNKDYIPGYLNEKIDNIKRSIENNNYHYSNVSPDIQEWVRRYSIKDKMYTNAVKEYLNVNGDKRGYDIVNNLISNGYHSFTKDSHGTRFILDTGSGPTGAVGSHLTGISRPLSAQIRGSKNLMYEELSYGYRQEIIAKSMGLSNEYNTIKSNKSANSVREYLVNKMKNFDVNITPTISTNDVVNKVREINEGGFNIIPGVTANLKQSNSQKFLKQLNSIKSNVDVSESLLSSINNTFSSNFTIDDLSEVLDVIGTNYSTYEQGGMLNPRFSFLYDKPQQFTEEVSEDVYNSIKSSIESNSPYTLNKGDDLGVIKEGGKTKKFRGQSGLVTGIEPVGGSINTKYKVNYIHQGENTNNAVKLAVGYGEKGVFSIPKIGGNKSELLQGVYDALFGKDTFAVASFEFMKHDNFGALAFSDISTMYDYYRSNSNGYANSFVSRLNNLLPQYEFNQIAHPTTGELTLSYNQSPSLVGDKTMYKALATLRSDLKGSSNDVDKKLLHILKTNDANGIVRTEFNQMHLEEGMGDNVKYDRRTGDQLNYVYENATHSDEAREAYKNIQNYYESRVKNSTSKDDGIEILQNFKSTIGALQGNSDSVIESIEASSINVPNNMATWEEVADSIIFDFSRVNDNGAKVNSFKINIPGGLSISNPVNNKESIEELVIPLTRPYSQDSYMFSNMQKKISSLVVNLKAMETAESSKDYKELLSLRNKVDKGYTEFISSMYGELTDKDGVSSKLIRSSRFDEGSFVLARKVVEPLLDKKGKYLDQHANNFYDTVDGKIRYLDNVEISEEGFNGIGVSFEDVGEQLYDEKEGFGKYFSNSGKKYYDQLEAANENLRLANEKLKSNLLEESIEDVNLEINKIERIISDTKVKLGADYLQNEGVFGLGERFPIVKTDSALPIKFFYNPILEGRTAVFSPTITKKTKLDVDGDQFAILMASIVNKDTGEIKLLNENSELRRSFEIAHAHEAKYNEKIVNDMSNERISDFEGNKMIHDGRYSNVEDSIPLWEQYSRYLSDNDKLVGSILEHDNFYNDISSVDQALQTISSKSSIGYLSNENYILKMLAESKYKGDESELEAMSLIRDYAGDAEQKIFNTKHMKASDGEYSMLLSIPYKNALNDMATLVDEDELRDATDRFVSVSKRSGIFDSDAEINLDKIFTDSPDIPNMNKEERTVYAISNMLQDDKVRAVKQDSLFWNQHYSKVNAIEELKNIFGDNIPHKYDGELGDYWDIFRDLGNYKYLKIDGEYIGKDSYINGEGDFPYRVNNLISSGDGFDVVEIENIFGERYHTIGKSFDDISDKLSNEGFKLSPKFTKDIIDETKRAGMFLRETKTHSNVEISSKMKSFYDDSVNIASEMSDDMNYAIRKNAFEKRRMDFYRENIPNDLYNDFDEYVRANDNSIEQLNITSYADPVNVKASSTYMANDYKSLHELGKGTINVNGAEKTLNDSSIDEIVNYVTSKNNSSNAIDNSVEQAKYYLINNMNLQKKYGDTLERGSYEIQDAAAESMNNAIREGSEKLSREVKKKVGSEFLNNSIDYVSKHKFVTAALIAGAIGIVSTVSDINTKPLDIDKKPNGDSPSHDGVYDEKPVNKRQSPPSEKKAYLTQNNTSYDISVSNNGRSSVKDTINKLKHFADKGDARINVTQREDTSKVSDSWIEEKIGDLL